MARRSDRFIKVHWEAERLLQEMEIGAQVYLRARFRRPLPAGARSLNSGGSSEIPSFLKWAPLGTA